MVEIPNIPDENSDPLRLQALDLFDRCIAQGDLTPIIAFLERQLLADPPALDLFRAFADDLQQRLVTLRTSLYDERNKLVNTFSEQYGLDVTSQMPPDDLDHFHQLNPVVVLTFARFVNRALNAQDLNAMGNLMSEALAHAAHIMQDVEATEVLYGFVVDWFEALCASSSRTYWDELPPTRGLLH